MPTDPFTKIARRVELAAAKPRNSGKTLKFGAWAGLRADPVRWPRFDDFARAISPPGTELLHVCIQPACCGLLMYVGADVRMPRTCGPRS